MHEATTALPITIENLTRTYGSLYALDDVDLQIKSGEFLTLLGPSGSGKTTLLMAIAGFNRPDSGSIRFGDKEIILTPPHKRDVGMVFQNYALFPHMTVAQNIAYPLKLRRVSKSDRAKKVEVALATVQLHGLGNRKIDQLSGGQRQRVALARAFVFGPRILLMDEPLSALDKKLREQMQIELKQLHRELGVTTVYVTHDQREALTMSDRIAVINHGKLVQVGSPEEIYSRPGNSFVADFIGESTILPLEHGNDGSLYLDDHCIGQQPETDARNTDNSWSLVLRPERLTIHDSASQSDQALYFDGVVLESVFQGESAFAQVKIANKHNIMVRFGTNALSPSQKLNTDDRVTLRLNTDDIIIIPGDPANTNPGDFATDKT